MDDRDKTARLRAEEIAEALAIRREEARMARTARALEHAMTKFKDAEERTEREIEDEWRREHWGHDPERRPVWPNHRER